MGNMHEMATINIEIFSFARFNNMNNNRQWGAAAAQEEKLKMRVKPSNVSGPVHLTQLAGRCFRKILEK